MAKLWGVLAKLAHLHFEHACCCLPSESLFVSSFFCLHYKQTKNTNIIFAIIGSEKANEDMAACLVGPGHYFRAWYIIPGHFGQSLQGAETAQTTDKIYSWKMHVL